jgi:predicted ester cyclase
VVFLVGAETQKGATLEKNKALVMRYADEVWGKGDMAVADEIIATDYIRHDEIFPEGILRGREAMKQYVMRIRTALPDFKTTAVAVIAEGDKVVVHWANRGTFAGKIAGEPAPTGKVMTWESLILYRIAGDKIVEDWCFSQDLSLMYQWGMKLVPASE